SKSSQAATIFCKSAFFFLCATTARPDCRLSCSLLRKLILRICDFINLMARSGWLLAIVVLLSGCVVGPDYRRPAALQSRPMPSVFTGETKTNSPDWKAAEPAAHLPRDAWWELFGNPELSRLEVLAAS